MKIELDLPNVVLGKELEAEITQRAKEGIVLRLYQDRHVGASLAARLLGFSRRRWMEFCQQHGVMVTDYSFDDLQEDLDVIGRLSQAKADDGGHFQ